MDVTSDAGSLGKAAGADLLEGKLTLPLISLLKHDPSIRIDFEHVMLEGEYRRFSRELLIDKLESGGVLQTIRNRATTFADEARKNLEVLPKTEYRSALEEIPGFLIDRSM